MKKAEATPMDCLVCYCPYCEERIIELNADIRDMTVPDIEEETEIECSFCGKKFLAIIKD